MNKWYIDEWGDEPPVQAGVVGCTSGGDIDVSIGGDIGLWEYQITNQNGVDVNVGGHFRETVITNCTAQDRSNEWDETGVSAWLSLGCYKCDEVYYEWYTE